ncbi:hypothetical protein [Hymenobacter metallicola]|uniref:Uncharacterized protein n=1 Tax=Hymenobacter metallicola TaxID=2563114 RepID=A0A4Z0QEY3_9BACT|nr:hypothetical protein [Hymenobacter metallicola]TGE28304.1 hypothetical protein E5K02_02230 [Hymenobacter metallicola]
MKHLLLVVTLSTVAGLPPALAQAPQSVRTITLTKDETFHGTVQLANANTVAWIGNDDDHTARLLALSGGGQTVWEAKVQRPKSTYLHHDLSLEAWGNRLVVAEILTRDDDKLKGKTGQLLLHIVDEQGKVSRKLVNQPPLDKREERTTFTGFVENDNYYMVSEYRKPRDVTEEFFLDRYDLTTHTLQHTKLELPARFSDKEDKDRFTDWVFGGHQPNRNFFYRHTGTPGQKSNFKGDEGFEFEVKILDNAGHAVGGFTSALHQQLKPGTYSYYSGKMPHYAGQGHTPVWITKTSSTGSGKVYSTTYDLYDVSMGAIGDFYLEPTTGECWFLGEYANEKYGPRHDSERTFGTFLQRYSADGKLLSAVQAPYPLKPSAQIREVNYLRRVSYLRAPSSGALTMQFTPARYRQTLFATYDTQGQLKTTAAWPSEEVKNLGTKLSLTAGRFCTWEGSGTSQMRLDALLAAEQDDPLLRRIAPVAKLAGEDRDNPDYLFLSTLPGNKGLMLRHHAERKGGFLQVYTL